jgi:hypothetical protein
MNSLANMLRSGDRERAGQAGLFVQDAVRFGPDPTFARYLLRSCSLRALRENLRAADYFTRGQTIHTLRRIGPPANARHLASNFAWYLEYDPLHLQDLLSEMFRLGHRTRREHYLEEIARANSYLARWTLLEILEITDWRSFAEMVLPRLVQDAQPLVQAEAQWRLEELRLQHHPETSGAAPKSQLDEPEPSFLKLKINVGNYLSISGRQDYDLKLVEQVTAYLREHPITIGYDIEAYWQAFAVWT